jgi:hypothetical protein
MNFCKQSPERKDTMPPALGQTAISTGANRGWAALRKHMGTVGLQGIVVETVAPPHFCTLA